MILYEQTEEDDVDVDRSLASCAMQIRDTDVLQGKRRSVTATYKVDRYWTAPHT